MLIIAGNVAKDSGNRVFGLESVSSNRLGYNIYLSNEPVTLVYCCYGRPNVPLYQVCTPRCCCRRINDM